MGLVSVYLQKGRLCELFLLESLIVLQAAKQKCCTACANTGMHNVFFKTGYRQISVTSPFVSQVCGNTAPVHDELQFAWPRTGSGSIT